MTTKLNGSAVRWRASCAGAIATLLAGTIAQASNWTIQPAVTAGATYSDNILLTARGTKEEEVVAEITPSLRVQYDGARLYGQLQYQLESLFFADESDRNEQFSQLDALLTAEVAPELLFIDAQAVFAQTLVDPLQPIAFSNSIATGNRADYQAVYVAPRIERNLGSRARIDAEYRYGQLRYDQDDFQFGQLQDLDDHVLTVNVGSQDASRPFTWGLRYFDETVEFEQNVEVSFQTAEASAAYRLTPTLQLLGTGGRESDVRQNGAVASLDATAWSAGLRWEPSRRTVLEVTAGERWFGDTLDVNWTFGGRRYSGGLQYYESPLTVGQQLFQRPVLRDPEPGDPQGGLGANSAEVYVSRAANGWVSLEGRRNTISLRVYDEEREFISAAQFEQERGAQADWTYRLGPKSTLLSSLGWQQIDYLGAPRRDDFLTARLILTRQFSARSELSVTLRRDARRSDAFTPSELYEENSLSLRFRFEFGRVERRDSGSAEGVDATPPRSERSSRRTIRR